MSDRREEREKLSKSLFVEISKHPGHPDQDVHSPKVRSGPISRPSEWSVPQSELEYKKQLRAAKSGVTHRQGTIRRYTLQGRSVSQGMMDSLADAEKKLKRVESFGRDVAQGKVSFSTSVGSTLDVAEKQKRTAEIDRRSARTRAGFYRNALKKGKDQYGPLSEAKKLSYAKKLHEAEEKVRSASHLLGVADGDLARAKKPLKYADEAVEAAESLFHGLRRLDVSRLPKAHRIFKEDRK